LVIEQGLFFSEMDIHFENEKNHSINLNPRYSKDDVMLQYH